MDNAKMGAMIREARKKKGLTQKDIATHLNITDRAVSKWERGICAPDLALLEPLADILEISITELITGELEVVAEHKEELEHVVKETIQYSKQEITNKKNGFTVENTGYWNGSTCYLNAKFRGMWWSPDSKYRVVSMNDTNNKTQLTLVDYTRNCECNLTVYLEMALYEKDFREGYMWYDYESGALSGEMELEQGKKKNYWLHGIWDGLY